MKLATILFALLLVVPAASADLQVKSDPGPAEPSGRALGCDGAPRITCGEILMGTSDGPSAVAQYGCSGLDYSACGESVYELCVGSDDDVTVTMTYQHDGSANDLDLFLLSDCDENLCLDASLGTSGLETIGPLALTAGTYYVVVDGWNALCNGSGHTLSVTCDAPCETVSVDPSTWGEVKGLYR
jgi:hypothetical protein